MNFCRTILLTISLLIFYAGLGGALLRADEIGSWNKYQVEKRLNERWKVYTGEEVRFRERTGFYYEETSVGLNYQALKHLAVGAVYLQTHSGTTKNGRTSWQWISKPKVYVTPQVYFKGFSLEDRNSLEYHFIHDQRDILLYRNMVSLTAPWKWTRLEFRPYTANEIFKETDRGGISEDRLYGGFKMHWWGPIYGRIFYLRDATNNSSGQWNILNVIGSDLDFIF